MPTKVVVDARDAINYGALNYEAAKRLIDLVEEYGDALLSLTCGGSEFFRKSGSEVDPQACVEYVRNWRQSLVNTLKIIKEKTKPQARSETSPKPEALYVRVSFNGLWVEDGHTDTRVLSLEHYKKLVTGRDVLFSSSFDFPEDYTDDLVTVALVKSIWQLPS